MVTAAAAAAAATVFLIFGHLIMESSFTLSDRDDQFLGYLVYVTNTLLLTNLIKEFLSLFYMVSCSLPLPL